MKQYETIDWKQFAGKEQQKRRSAEHKIKKLNTSIHKAQQMLRNIVSHCRVIESKRQVLEIQNKTYHEKLTTAVAMLKNAKVVVQQHKDVISSMQQQHKDSLSSMQQQHNEALSSMQQQHNDAITTLQQQHANAQQEINHLLQGNSELKENMIKLQSEIYNIKQNHLNIQQQKDALQNETNDLQQKIAQQQKQYMITLQEHEQTKQRLHNALLKLEFCSDLGTLQTSTTPTTISPTNYQLEHLGVDPSLQSFFVYQSVATDQVILHNLH